MEWNCKGGYRHAFRGGVSKLGDDVDGRAEEVRLFFGFMDHLDVDRAQGLFRAGGWGLTSQFMDGLVRAVVFLPQDDDSQGGGAVCGRLQSGVTFTDQMDDGEFHGDDQPGGWGAWVHAAFRV